MSITKMNPNVTYGLWMIMMCQCRFINYNQSSTLVGDVEKGKAMHVVGQGVYGKPLDFQFCCGSKTDQKYKKSLQKQPPTQMKIEVKKK